MHKCGGHAHAMVGHERRGTPANIGIGGAVCDEVRQNASISRRYIGEQAHMQFRAIRALMT